jgi:hypothetical protein
MSDKNTPPADETAPIAGQRPAADPAAGPAASAPYDAASAGPPADAPYDAAPADGATGTTSGRSWRERLRRGTAGGGSRTFGLGALVAGTLAGLIIGGIGGATIAAAVSDHDDRGERIGHRERGFPGDHGSFGQLPRQVPPGALPAPRSDAPESTPPTEDDDSDGSTES